MGARQLKICNNFQLVVNQIILEFEAKDASMATYLTHARRLLNHFSAYQVQQIPDPRTDTPMLYHDLHPQSTNE